VKLLQACGVEVELLSPRLLVRGKKRTAGAGSTRREGSFLSGGRGRAWQQTQRAAPRAIGIAQDGGGVRGWAV